MEIVGETEISAVAGRGAASLHLRIDGYGKVLETAQDTGPGRDDPVVTLGLVDLQVNGFAGVDFNRADITAAELDRALVAMLARGATRCLPTVITSSLEQMTARLRALDRAIQESRLGPWMVAGFHVEGPFLSPEDGYAGCHPKEHMLAPDWQVFARITDGLTTPVRIVTVAPERAGVLDFIAEAKRQGLVVAIGHTSATFEQVGAAAAAGATLSTHLGNGVYHSLEKNENPLFAQLSEDRLSASFIADGIHIPPANLKIYLRAKEYDRTVLVTDATAGADAEPGLYTLGDVPIEKCADGVVREPGARYLGGSSATMESMAGNLSRWFGTGLAEFVDFARTHPLRLLGQETPVKPGDPAELVWWEQGEGGPEVLAARVGPFRINRGML